MRPQFLFIITLLYGCLVTDVEGDPDLGTDIAINGLLIRTTCVARIECAPPLTFEWCAFPQRHPVESNDYVWTQWFEQGCPNTLQGRIDCEAGGTPCSRRGLVEPSM